MKIDTGRMDEEAKRTKEAREAALDEDAIISLVVDVESHENKASPRADDRHGPSDG